MWNNSDSTVRLAANELHLKDLLPAISVCVAYDPGQDESSDPDDFPMDDHPDPPPPDRGGDDGPEA
jgi:hypothetical protein